MKKKYVKMLVYGLVTVMLMSSLSGCSGCKDKDKDELVTSEIVSEEVSEEVSEAVSEETSVETSEAVSEEVSEEVKEEVSEEVSEETSAETPETPSEEVPEETAPAYTVEPMSATMYAQRSVNVRKGPGTEYDRVGSLTTNQEVAVTGKASTGWYEISYNGEVAYVSNSYLGNEKVVVQTTPTTPSAPETTTPATPDAGTTAGTTSETTYTVYLEPNMLGLVNGHRTANGVPALTWNSAKEQEALDRIKAVAQNGQLSHSGNPANAENLACVYGYADANTFYTNYYNSPGHNQVMLYNSNIATSISMVSATCVVSNGGFNTYYNVILIYATYSDSNVSWDW